MATRSGQPRVVVGVEDSPASRAALRQAVVQARCRGAELHVVYARRPVKVTDAPAPIDGCFDATGWVNVAVTRERALREATIKTEEGRALVAACLYEAVGGTPSDMTVRVVVAVGKPGPELLAQAWCDDDLLVLGTRGGRRWRHLRRGSVSRYCARHARCPVLVVPDDESNYAAALDDLRHDLRQLGSGRGLPPNPRRPAVNRRAS